MCAYQPLEYSRNMCDDHLLEYSHNMCAYQHSHNMYDYHLLEYKEGANATTAGCKGARVVLAKTQAMQSIST